MDNYIYAYLRASTAEQDATRARSILEQFATHHNFRIAAFFVENASGTTLYRPELMRLLEQTRPGDSILIESIDRLSRMHPENWEKLKHMIKERGLNIVSIDLPTTHSALIKKDIYTDGVINAFNQLIIDILAIFAHKDYLQRRERQKQGIERAKASGKYRGRKKDSVKHAAILNMLKAGISQSDIAISLEVSRSTVNRVRKAHADELIQSSVFDLLSQ